MVIAAQHLSLLDELLASALAQRASDVHFEPTADGYSLRVRIDGVLQNERNFDSDSGRSMVGRLMVRAKLLTYRTDVPQEGRFTLSTPGETSGIELRLAVMPTNHGLRAAVRMPADRIAPTSLEALNLPEKVLHGLHDFITSDSGMLILSGPAGAGKTTTIYAILSQLARDNPGLSIVSLEDPIERDLPGVTQIEVSPFGQLTYERALRSILRQDPQVLMLGEIRDAATASLAIGAALSGHRLITTLHAANAAGALERLLEMGLEPHQLTSSIFGIVSQRLLRKRDAEGYKGRVPIAEWAPMQSALRSAILARADIETLQHACREQPGFQSLADAGRELVANGISDETELRRVIGRNHA